MRITFDPAKNAHNIEERNLPFELVAQLDWETAVAIEDTRRDYGERRLRVPGSWANACMPPSLPCGVTRCTSSVSAR
jgi:uncharacterized DUF497 family protein